jgi:hypothetical protein
MGGYIAKKLIELPLAPAERAIEPTRVTAPLDEADLRPRDGIEHPFAGTEEVRFGGGLPGGVLFEGRLRLHCHGTWV